VLGFIFRQSAGEVLGFKGLIGSIIGFYSLFMGLYLFATLFIKLTYDSTQSPSFVGRWLGLAFGIFEGVVIFGLFGFLLNFFPNNGSSLSKSLPSILGEKLGEVVVDPLVENSASSPIVLLKVAREIQKGSFDPSKVDRQTLLNQFGKLPDHPKIRALTEDPELERLLIEKNFIALVKHPKVLDFANDPEILKISETIDWAIVAKALRQGIKK